MIGDRLTSLRKEKNMTQEELGQFVKLSKISISQYENNKNIPTEDTLIQFARIFNVSLDYLAGLTHEPFSYERESKNIVRIPEEIPDQNKWF